MPSFVNFPTSMVPSNQSTASTKKTKQFETRKYICRHPLRSPLVVEGQVIEAGYFGFTGFMRCLVGDRDAVLCTDVFEYCFEPVESATEMVI